MEVVRPVVCRGRAHAYRWPSLPPLMRPAVVLCTCNVGVLGVCVCGGVAMLESDFVSTLV